MTTIRKFIGFIPCWTCFILGDWISHLLYYDSLVWLYPTYNKLMLISSDIQDWAKLNKPWESK